MKLHSIYISSFHEGSHELSVAIGLVNFLKSRYKNVAYFKPIVASENDAHLETINNYFMINEKIADLYCFTSHEAEKLEVQGKWQELVESILMRYKELRERYEFVVIEGFDRNNCDLPIKLDFQIAKNTGSGYMAILNGAEKNDDEILNEIYLAKNSIREEGCDLFGVCINNINSNKIQRLHALYTVEDDLVIFLPQIKELDILTIGEIEQQLGCERIFGSDNNLNRQIGNKKIASMKLENFFDNIEDNDLVIVSADRTDILFGCFLSFYFKNLSHIAGIVLTGDSEVDHTILAMTGSNKNENFTILKLPYDTYEVVKRIDSVRAEITSASERKIARILGKFNRHADLEKLRSKLQENLEEVVTPMMFEYAIFQKAMKAKQHIVLPEANDDRILRAAEILLLRKVVTITLLGDETEIIHRAKSLGLNLTKAKIINPQTSNLTVKFANAYYELRKHKGVLPEYALELMTKDYNYFGTMMVYEGLVDGMVSGATGTTANTVKPALQIIKTAPGIDIVSSLFFMCLENNVLVFADCAINQSPSARELATIAITSANTAQSFGIKPRIAMLSYATGNSANSHDVQKVKDAVLMVKAKAPKLQVEGPLQYDAAIDPIIGAKKLPGSLIAGHANVLIFPDLNSGNNTYKAVQRSSGAIAVGPILQGLNGAINDLSRGASVSDIVYTVAITAIQAMDIKK